MVRAKKEVAERTILRRHFVAVSERAVRHGDGLSWISFKTSRMFEQALQTDIDSVKHHPRSNEQNAHVRYETSKSACETSKEPSFKRAPVWMTNAHETQFFTIGKKSYHIGVTMSCYLTSYMHSDHGKGSLFPA